MRQIFSPGQERGFVSLFTTIMISLLLLVITLSIVSLQVLQLRKSEDSEQTLRAYYAAEAGVEDAVSKVLSKTIAPGVGDDTCNANATYDIPGAAGWTCQQVSFLGTPTGKLDQPDVAKTIDPGSPTPGYNSVIVEWNQSSNGAGAYYTYPPTMPDFATGSANYAAPIELAIVQYPNGGFKASDLGGSLKLQNALIVPGGTSAGAVVNYAAGLGTGPYRGNCGPRPRTLPPAYGGGTLDYNCYAVITHLNGAGTNYLFRIRSRYTASSYQMVFKSGATGGGAVVSVPDGVAMIDVTAKAGQTYRRVISTLPLNPSAAAELNYVIYADTDVCKNFEVIDNIAQPGCPY